MSSLKITLAGTSRAAAIVAIALAPLPALSIADSESGDAETGKKIATERTLGNCVACHVMPDAESPGAIGPALVGMQARFPDKEKLRAQIWDATATNPESIMPPFGKHEILTNQQLNDVLAYIWSI